MTSGLKVIVAQMGARHSYAVPRMLHRHGALNRLYTDFCLKGVARRAAGSLLCGLKLPLAGKLRRRTVQGIPDSKIFTAPLINVRSASADVASSGDRYRLENEIFGQNMIRWGTGDANVVYAMYGSGVPFWRHAKSQGLKIAVDLFVTPLWHRIVAREHENYPDWGNPTQRSTPNLDATERDFREAIAAADLLLCPSPIVQQDIATLTAQTSPAGSAPPKTVVVPYGIPNNAIVMPRAVPAKGRILFAGEASVRKGIHYLAMAAHSLRDTRQNLDFRIAGLASEQLRNHPMARHLTFLGHLSREQMRAEYAKADVFVLPTLAEGSAGVVYEALAAGLPVVTTPSAGSVITDGKEGLLVPERDSEALAEAIESIVRDRNLRDDMANAATVTAYHYREHFWGERLIAALHMLD
jgi:glycosyltransferase involved in cell wall biosynthesis